MSERYFVYTFLATVSGIITLLIPLGAWRIPLILLIFALLLILTRRRVLIPILCALCILSSLNTTLRYKEYHASYNDVTVSGTVTSVVQVDENTTLRLDDCTFSQKDMPEGSSVNVTYVFQHRPESISEGNRVTVSGVAYPAAIGRTPLPASASSTLSAIYENCFYNIQATELSVTDRSLNYRYYLSALRGELRERIFNNIHHSGSASVLFSMVSGDRTYVSDDVSDVFAACGTTHLLAVSGLHVGIIISAISMLLKRLRLKAIFRILLSAAFIVFYCAFTDFSVSVIRASIMAFFFTIADSTGERYDSLNTLGLAGTFILLISPYALFDVAFQLSFAASFGVTVFSRYTRKDSMPLTVFINTAIMTVGATVFTMPILLYYFGYASIISVIANVLAVPIASVALLLTFAFALLTFVWSGFGFLLKMPGYFMELILKALQLLARVPAIKFAFIPALLIVAIVVAPVFLTRYVHVSRKIMRACLICLILLLMLAPVANSLVSANTVRFSIINNSSLAIHIRDNGNTLIGIDPSGRQSRYLERCTGRINNLFILTQSQLESLEMLDTEALMIDNIFIAPHLKMNEYALRVKARHLDDEITLGSLTYKFADGGLLIKCGEREIFVHDGVSSAPTGKYYMTVSPKAAMRSDIAVTYDTPDPWAKTLYRVKEHGFVTLLLWR